jgi:hypothetical protein
MSFWCLQISEKTNEIYFIKSFSLASKNSSYKNGALYTTNWRIFILTLLHDVFDLTTFLRLGQKSFTKSVGFLGDLKAAKGNISKLSDLYKALQGYITGTYIF